MLALRLAPRVMGLSAGDLIWFMFLKVLTTCWLAVTSSAFAS